MSEYRYLLIIGIFLWALLGYSAYYESTVPLYAFSAYLIFEALTNLRLTSLLKRFNKPQGTTQYAPKSNHESRLNEIEAGRVFRIIIAALIYASIALLPDLLWFMPWFIAGMLIMAGITNICPMHMFLRWAGLK